MLYEDSRVSQIFKYICYFNVAIAVKISDWISKDYDDNNYKY